MCRYPLWHVVIKFELWRIKTGFCGESQNFVIKVNIGKQELENRPNSIINVENLQISQQFKIKFGKKSRERRQKCLCVKHKAWSILFVFSQVPLPALCLSLVGNIVPARWKCDGTMTSFCLVLPSSPFIHENQAAECIIVKKNHLLFTFLSVNCTRVRPITISTSTHSPSLEASAASWPGGDFRWSLQPPEGLACLSRLFSWFC